MIAETSPYAAPLIASGLLAVILVLGWMAKNQLEQAKLNERSAVTQRSTVEALDKLDEKLDAHIGDAHRVHGTMYDRMREIELRLWGGGQ